jgi:hypothetical protein
MRKKNRHLQMKWRVKSLSLTLQTKCNVLKEIVTLLGLFEYLAAIACVYMAGAKEYQGSLVFLVLMGISYYASTKLNYKVVQLIFRIENERNK